MVPAGGLPPGGLVPSGGLVPAGGRPARSAGGADFDGDAELCDVDVETVCAAAVPAVEIEPLDEASATPVTPAASPAAVAPVMMSRRMRPPDVETIRLPPFSAATASRAVRRKESACAAGLPGSRATALRAL